MRRARRQKRHRRSAASRPSPVRSQAWSTTFADMMVDGDRGVVEGHAQVRQPRLGTAPCAAAVRSREPGRSPESQSSRLERGKRSAHGPLRSPPIPPGRTGARARPAWSADHLVRSRTIRCRNESTSPLRWPRRPAGDTRPGCSIARLRPVPGPLTSSAGSGQPPITAASRSAGRSRTCCTTVRGAGVTMVLKRSVKIISRAGLPSPSDLRQFLRSLQHDWALMAAPEWTLYV